MIVNIRSRIDALDTEIARLGGVPNIKTTASDSIGSTVLSRELFSSGKNPSGRPSKSDPEANDSENATVPSTQKKRRGRPPKKQNCILSDETMSPLTTIAMSLISLKTGGIAPVFAVNSASTDSGKTVTAESSAADRQSEPPRDWLCLCGLTIEGWKTRCGKCRRWKGGKREKKWTLKDTNPKVKAEPKKRLKRSETSEDEQRKKKKLGRPFKTVNDIYKKLSNDNHDSQSNNDKKGNSKGEAVSIRFEVESVIGNLLAALSEEASNKKRRKTTLTDPEKKPPTGGFLNKSVHQEKNSDTVIADENVVSKLAKEKADTKNDGNKPAPLAFESLCHVFNMRMSEDEAPKESKLISSY